jgi:hypothetical protein
MAVSWRGGCGLLVRSRGVNSMTIALLIAGIGLLLAGLLTVGYGIMLELSTGNTLVFAGTMVACTGVIVLGIWIVVRELKNIAGQLGLGIPAPSRAATSAPSAKLERQAPENAGFLFGQDQPAPEHADQSAPPPLSSAPSPAPWQEEAAARDRGRNDAPPAPEPVEAAPAVKPKRNLLFSSSSRKERERAEGRATEPSAPAQRPAPSVPPPVPEPDEVSPPATFDDAWPQSERTRTPEAPRRGVRPPSTFAEPNTAAPAPDRYPPVPRNGDAPPVTVLKSGVVDGMAYSLYSDGSIEAQMPEGMMRFASIDELRSHLDQRP